VRIVSGARVRGVTRPLHRTASHYDIDAFSAVLLIVRRFVGFQIRTESPHQVSCPIVFSTDPIQHRSRKVGM
jgi:hypothetical protein